MQDDTERDDLKYIMPQIHEICLIITTELLICLYLKPLYRIG